MPDPRSRESDPPPRSFLLCDETGEVAGNKGHGAFCPEHERDGCLAIYVRLGDLPGRVQEELGAWF